MRFVVDKVVPGRVCSRHFKFPPSISLHQCSIHICTCTLLLPDEQTGEAWEPSRKQCSSENGERWIEKNFQFLLVCNKLNSSKRSVHSASSLLSSGTSVAVHRQTLDTNTNDSSSSDVGTKPRNVSCVSHLTSCLEIWFVSIVPKIRVLQISTFSNNSLASLISNT